MSPVPTTSDPAQVEVPSAKKIARAVDGRLRYPLVWLLFIVVMCTGAALLMVPGQTTLGLVLLVSPIVVFGAVAAAYYLFERLRSS